MTKCRKIGLAVGSWQQHCWHCGHKRVSCSSSARLPSQTGRGKKLCYHSARLLDVWLNSMGYFCIVVNGVWVFLTFSILQITDITDVCQWYSGIVFNHLLHSFPVLGQARTMPVSYISSQDAFLIGWFLSFLYQCGDVWWPWQVRCNVNLQETVHQLHLSSNELDKGVYGTFFF